MGSEIITGAITLDEPYQISKEGIMYWKNGIMGDGLHVNSKKISIEALDEIKKSLNQAYQRGFSDASFGRY